MFMIEPELLLFIDGNAYHKKNMEQYKCNHLKTMFTWNPN